MRTTIKPFISLFLRNTNSTHAFLDVGYKKIINSNELSKIKLIIQLICEFEYHKSSSSSKSSVFNKINNSSLSLFTSQRLTSHLLKDFSFNRAIACYFSGAGDLVYPLKKDWQEIFLNHGIKINKIACSLLWKVYLTLSVVYESSKYLNRFLRIILRKYSRVGEKNNFDPESLNVYFYNVSKENLPSVSNELSEKNIVTWYTKYILNNSKINVLHNVRHDISNNTSNSSFRLTYFEELFINSNVLSEIRNLFWFFKLILMKLVKFDIGINLILNFNEIMKAKFVSDNIGLINLHSIVFNHSIGSIKPLWSIVLEENSVTLDYCFYSSNSEPLDFDGNLPIDGFWKLANWKNIYVLDHHQKLQLEEQVIYKANIMVPSVMPWWVDNGMTIPIFEKKTICLFDTVMHNNLYLLSTLYQTGWGKVDTAIDYLSSVLEVARELNMLVLYKMKRIRAENVRNRIHWNAISKLIAQNKNLIISFDEGVSAVRLILASTITVSNPLSTTALIAKSVGKPSFYYDPTGKISSFDPALREIPILSNKQDLLKAIKYEITKAYE